MKEDGMRGKVDRDQNGRRTTSALLSLALVVGLFTYGFRMVRVKGHSMDPTYHNGQWLLVRRPNWPSPSLKVGDVVVFRLEGDILVKRVAALGGQHAPSQRGVLLVHPSYKRPKEWKAFIVESPPETVPAGQIYVLGDNPPVSDDSRSFGPVPVSALLGRVLRWREPGRPPTPADRQAAR
jgi:signal peptidase I